MRSRPVPRSVSARRRVRRCRCSILSVPAAPVSATVTVTSHFIYTSPGYGTFVSPINNDATNGEANALLFVTPNYSAGGVCGCVADTVPIGVIYNLFGGAQWSIANLDEATNIAAGSTYNVLVVQKASKNVFVQTATSANTLGGRHLHQLAEDERQTERAAADHHRTSTRARQPVRQ